MIARAHTSIILTGTLTHTHTHRPSDDSGGLNSGDSEGDGDRPDDSKTGSDSEEMKRQTRGETCVCEREGAFASVSV